MSAGMRSTSLEAILQLRASRVLGELQVEVWHALAANGPLTGNELAKVMGRPNVHKRLSELKRLGLVVEVGVRECRVTEFSALAWAAQAPDPSKPPVRRKAREWWLVMPAGDFNARSSHLDRRSAAAMACLTDEIIKVREVPIKAKHAARDL